MPKEAGEDVDLVEDSDNLPSDPDEDGEDSASGGNDDEEDDDDPFALIEGSDNEDLISLEGDIPEGLLDHEGHESSEEEWGGINMGEDRKRKRDDTDGEKRKKLRSLPTFASYEDYAKIIEAEPEDGI